MDQRAWIQEIQDTTAVADHPMRRKKPWKRAMVLCKQQPLGAGSACFIVLIVLLAIFAGQVTRYDPYEYQKGEQLQAPSGVHYFGTDQYGRDVFSRTVFGARISLGVGLIAVSIGMFLGVFFGLLSGYWSGSILDNLIQRLVDSMMALPSLVLAIAIVGVLGISIYNAMIAIGIVMFPTASRVVRGAVLSTKENQYVEAARAIGCSHPRLLVLHILPNVFAPIIVLITTSLGGAIMVEASLSFLGYGTPVPEPSWGAMMSIEARKFLEGAPWIGLFPGIALSLTVLSFNLAGDSLRDVLDPRMRGR